MSCPVPDIGPDGRVKNWEHLLRWADDHAPGVKACVDRAAGNTKLSPADVLRLICAQLIYENAVMRETLRAQYRAAKHPPDPYPRI